MTKKHFLHPESLLVIQKQFVPLAKSREGLLIIQAKLLSSTAPGTLQEKFTFKKSMKLNAAIILIC
jgi:hypothetical protein